MEHLRTLQQARPFRPSAISTADGGKVPIRLLIALPLLLLTACSTISRTQSSDTPETVLITYHVRSGREAELRKAISEAWELYRKERLVFAQPHVVTCAKENRDKTRFVEIFTWINHEAPDHVPSSIQSVWDRMQTLCEARGGPQRIEITEVELVLPPHTKF